MVDATAGRFNAKLPTGLTITLLLALLLLLEIVADDFDEATTEEITDELAARLLELFTDDEGATLLELLTEDDEGAILLELLEELAVPAIENPAESCRGSCWRSRRSWRDWTPSPP